MDNENNININDNQQPQMVQSEEVRRGEYLKFALIVLGILILSEFLTYTQTNSFFSVVGLSNFMGMFFIVFGIFKFINLKTFAMAYKTYDIVAKRFTIWGYLYPFIEIILGILYIGYWFPIATNIINFTIMIISSIGVLRTLFDKQKVRCASLGLIIDLPVDYITVVEDLGMAFLALLMIIRI
jgi:hypothetical protein